MPKRILIANFYLEGREQAARTGDYPRSHLWGMDGLVAAGYDIRLLSHSPQRPLLKKLTKWTRGVFGDLAESAEIRKQAKDCDAIYIITGHYPLLRRARAGGQLACPVFSWLYMPPSSGQKRLSEKLLPALTHEVGIDGYLCLTKAAETHIAANHPGILARKVNWGADLDMFRPGRVKTPLSALACGRSGRDFDTLLQASALLPIPLELVAPRSVATGRSLPPTVRFLGGPENSTTDKGLTYHKLIEIQQSAFCHIISLKDDPCSAAGYTNLLEALAVGRPVIMTKTGCLDIDIEREGVGLWSSPNDPHSLAQAVKRLVDNPYEAEAMGQRGLRLMKERFNLETLNEGVVGYFMDAIGKP